MRANMMPFSSGDGYEAPGRAMQQIGRGIQDLGGAFASLQGMADREDEFATKLALLNMSNEQDREDIERQSAFNPDVDNPDEYAPGRMTSFDTRAQSVIAGAKSQNAQRMAALQIARMRGTVGERAQRFATGQKQQQMYFGAERAITGEFDKLSAPIEVPDEPPPVMGPTPAEGAREPGMIGPTVEEGAQPAQAPQLSKEERRAALEAERFEMALRSAEAIIGDIPGTPETKQRLAKHVAGLAMAHFGKRGESWPQAEAWLQRQQGQMPGQPGQPGQPGAPSGAAPSPRSGSASEFLRSKLAPGYEKRVSDVENLAGPMKDRLAAFIAAAEDAGHDIRVVSGHRDAQRQAVLWQKALAKYGSAEIARRYVAPPGGSTHQSGEAVDLQYQDRGAGLGGKRTAAVEWAHKNAAKFGLHFPLGHEDWHIEPTEARQGGRRFGGSYAAGKTYWTPQPSALGGPAPSAEPATATAAAPVPVSQRGLTQYAGLTPPSAAQPAAGSPSSAPTSIPPHITAAAEKVGMLPEFLARISQIESSGNPNKRTGSYVGEFQLSQADFKKYGGTGSITDPAQNAMAAANKFADLSRQFSAKTGREPTAGELYLMHQQGAGGAMAHIENPDRPAWQSMASTAEGRQKGEAWAKQAIWGNLTPEAKRQFGSVDNVTSRQFVEFWSGRAEMPVRVAQASTGTMTDARATNTIPGQRAPQVAQSAYGMGQSPVRGELSEALQKALPAMRERYRAQVDGSLKQIEEMAAKGYEVDDATINRVAGMVSKTQDQALMQRMEMLGPIVRNSRATNMANEAELTAAIRRHLPALATANAQGMRWKRFLYKQLCEQAGGGMCQTPDCRDCADHLLCFPAD